MNPKMRIELVLFWCLSCLGFCAIRSFYKDPFAKSCLKKASKYSNRSFANYTVEAALDLSIGGLDDLQSISELAIFCKPFFVRDNELDAQTCHLRIVFYLLAAQIEVAYT